MERQDEDRDLFSRSLSLTLSQNSQSNQTIQTENSDGPSYDELLVLLRPPFIRITANDIIRYNQPMARFRSRQNFDGVKAYRCAIAEEARLRQLSILPNIIGILTQKLWASEPRNVQDAYRNLSHTAEITFLQHHLQFLPENAPENKCKGCEEH